MWYLTRGSGVVTLVLLTAALVLGIVTSVRWSSPRWPRFVTETLHRNVSLLVVVFLAIHVVTAVVDAFAPIRWIDAVVPFASPYRPVWLGLGAVALDLLLALAVTSLLRVRVGYTAWRAVHWTAYACWPIALVHGLGTGSDTTQAWMLLLDVAAVGTVVVAVWWRLATGWPERAGGRMVALGASVLVPLAVFVWVVAGPLRPGWARTAGTPAALVTGGASSAAPSATSPSPANGNANHGAVPTLPFSLTFTGTVTQSGPDQDGFITVDLHGPLSGSMPLVLDISLRGRPAANGVALADGRVRLGPPGDASRDQGGVTGLSGGRIQALLSDANGNRIALTTVVHVGERTVQGVVEGTRAAPGSGP